MAKILLHNRNVVSRTSKTIEFVVAYLAYYDIIMCTGLLAVMNNYERLDIKHCRLSSQSNDSGMQCEKYLKP